ncbi:poly-beta-1,6-N-acetyl-D-glucosamine synthase [Microbulbifer elongatus]|uniref:poly-beta-1,6-N-acetyl-D-glucosamine synthase n=1 Tax=Microbulbifer elongatus TaxID=86173 RepID=UPI001E463268|nr:poly-beta-1,6-N-acetyl-D-glucosamine synthase [Microbulbifer elongatus]
MNWTYVEQALAIFCFGYPFVMAYYWITGAVLFFIVRERHQPQLDSPPELTTYPGVSILVPCYNEGTQVRETIENLSRITYPNFEVIAVNDGSVDETGQILDDLCEANSRLSVIHLASNQGKSCALNTGALAARYQILVCIDGDALLDRNALHWIVRQFQVSPRIGGIAGNPRIRNRSSIVGLLQVGEFSGMVGLIRRAQNIYGSFFTVSGAVCAFRKRALQEAGWWNTHALTDDVDMTWRVQMAGWNVEFVPKALAWILTPETFRGLWRQRVRWSEGGTTVILRYFPQLFSRKGLRMWPIWINYVLSILWSYTILLFMGVGLLHQLGISFGLGFNSLGFLPDKWGMTLALTYLLQALIAALLDRRVEPDIFRSLYWIIWYPLIFWVVQALTAIVGLPRSILYLRHQTGTWTSPDRGFR